MLNHISNTPEGSGPDFLEKPDTGNYLTVYPSYFCELRKTKLRLEKIILSCACKYTIRFLANKIQD